MANPLNWIYNDSKRAAQVYAALVAESSMDSRLRDFHDIGKDHEHIVGDVGQRWRLVGGEPRDKSRRNWPEDLHKARGKRLYEDVETLRALRDAERAELEDCRRMLDMNGGDRLVNTFVSNQVLPVLERHVETLDRYLRKANGARHH